MTHLHTMFVTLAMTAMLSHLAEAQTSKALETCTAIGEISETIMAARQTNIPMSKTLSLLDEMHDMPPQLKSMVSLIVTEAYRQPPMRTEQNKRNQRSDFRNTMELTCFSVLLD